MKKKVCILTKSLKDGNYCVAGIDINNGAWIRLVASDTGEAIPKDILDDDNINEFDIVDVNVKRYVPHKLQKENWLIDKQNKIEKIGSITKGELKYIHNIENPNMIFGNHRSELNKEEIKLIKNTLLLVRVTNLKFDTSLKGDGKHHYKVNFTYNNSKYSLALTDPKFRKELYDNIVVPSAMIVVSIPAIPYGENDLYYKFVAKIII